MGKYVKGKYFNIKISDLKPGEPLNFHLYLYLPINGHIIPLRKPGDVFDQALFEKITAKSIGELYIREDERDAYLSYLNPPPPPVVDEVKVQEAAVEMLATEGEAHEEAKEEVQKVVEQILESAPGIDPALMGLLGHPSAEHATSVAVYGILFAIAAGYSDSATLADVAVSALIHDVGFTQVDPDVIVKPSLERNATEAAQFAAHVSHTQPFLAEVEYTPKETVIETLIQHHEKFDGTGYPAHLRGFKIQDLSQVVGFADFCDSMMRGWHDGKAHSMAESIQIISGIEKETTFPHFFNPDLFKKVLTWLNKGEGMKYMGQAKEMAETTKKKFLKAG